MEEAEELFRQVGARREYAKTLYYRAWIHHRRHLTEEALAALREMVSQLEGSGCDGFLLAERERTLPLVFLALRHRLAPDFFRRLKDRLTRPSAVSKGSGIQTGEILPYLEVYALGPGVVIRDGRPLRTSDWYTSTTRDLFFFFAFNPGGVFKEHILTRMWPETPPAKANNLFHSTLYRLRKAIHPRCIVYENGLYRFNERLTIWKDAAEFEALLEKARTERDLPRRRRLLSSALNLYRGDFLEDCYREWCIELRERYLRRYLRALLELAEIHLAEGRYDEAVELARKAVDKDPLLEDGYRILIEALALAGDKASAVMWFRRCRDVLRSELGVDPSPGVWEVYKQVRGG